MALLRQNWSRFLPLTAVAILPALFQATTAEAGSTPGCATSVCQFQTIQADLKANPSDPAARLKLAEYYSSRGQFATAYEQIQKISGVSTQSAEFRVVAAELQWKLGLRAQALSSYEKLAAGPLSPALKLRVAAGLEETGFHDKALRLAESAAVAGKASAAWDTVLRLAMKVQDGTAAERARTALASRETDGRFISRSGDEDRYLLKIADLGTPACPLTTRFLSDIRIDQFGNAGLESQRIQQWVQLGANASFPQAAIREIRYSPITQEVKLLTALLHKGNGDGVEGSLLAEQRVPEGTDAMYYGLRNLRVQFPGAEPGDLIELDYRITPKSDELLSGVGEIVSFSASMPTQLKRYVLLADSSSTPHITYTKLAAPAESSVGGQRVRVWEARNLEPSSAEPRSPAAAELAGYVSVSRFANWQELGTWYAKNIEAQFDLTPELQATVKDVVVKHATDIDRISAIQEFVLRNTHYVALELGAHSYKPYRVGDVYSRRFGDCKDKASLMIALLRAAGIDAQLALIRTQKLGEVSADINAVAAFNHAIVYIPRYETWIDATADYGAMNELPVEDQGAMALTVSLDGGAQLRRVPESSPDDNTTQRTIVADLRPDGNVSFRANQCTRGEEAPTLRRELESPDRQRDSLQRGLAETIPAVRVNDVQINRDARERVNIDFGGEVSSYRGKKELSVNNTWYARRYVRTLAPLLTRTQDLVITTPWKTDEELRVNLPAGARVKLRPAPFASNTRFGSASIQYELRDRLLVVHSSVEIHKGRVTPQEYAAFRDFCSQLDNAFREQVSITLP